MALSRIYKVLRTHFYYGDFMYGGKFYKGNYEALITKQVFEKVQLHLDVAPRQWNKQLFPFKKICKCAGCGSGVTAEIKHKRLVSGRFNAHIYYHCNRIKNYDCNEPYITETELIQQLVAHLPNIQLNIPFLMRECKNDIKRLQNLKSSVLREKSPRLTMTPYNAPENMIEQKEYDEDEIQIVRDYLLHVLKFGTPEERVQILGGIESKFILKDRKLILL